MWESRQVGESWRAYKQTNQFVNIFYKQREIDYFIVADTVAILEVESLVLGIDVSHLVVEAQLLLG